MAGFKLALENQVETILRDYAGLNGQYSDPVNYVVTWDRKIPDFNPQSDVPIVAIIGSTTNQRPRPSGEMGTSRELWDWSVNVYYLDVTTDFNSGYARMDDIGQRIRNGLEDEPRLRNLTVTVNPQSPTGATNEYVYNSDWASFTWDHSGIDGDYYAFVIEARLVVNTARN